MEILSYKCAPLSGDVNLRLELVLKRSNSRHSNLNFRKYRFLCTKIDSKCGSLRLCNLDESFVKKLNNQGSSSSLNILQGFRNVELKVLRGEYDGYVIGREDDARDILERGESETKVVIPNMPDESNGESCAPVSSCFWEWKPKFKVYYEKAGCENVNSPKVLFLPGFGVGSFHYEKQLKDLGRDFRVWAIDFLGQGMSLPVEDPTPSSSKGDDTSDGKDRAWGFGDETKPWASDLVYSIDLWQGQVQYFIEQVIGEPVYIVGNSLGGFVALYFAACYPHLVKGVTLLNATPFWGFLPNPIRSPQLAKLFPWAGTFPLPSIVKKLTEFIWQKISDPRSIAEVLKQVYADHSTNVDKVCSRIIETTQHPAAAASFASIMFAPQGKLSFREALLRSHMNNVPICLMYGKEDPWVRPIWGHQVKRQVPEAPYYEISPAGHCPHDEVPEVVNYLLRGWITNLETQGSVSLPLLDDGENVLYNIARDLEFVRDGSRKSVRVLINFSILTCILKKPKPTFYNQLLCPKSLEMAAFVTGKEIYTVI